MERDLWYRYKNGEWQYTESVEPFWGRANTAAAHKFESFTKDTLVGLYSADYKEGVDILYRRTIKDNAEAYYWNVYWDSGVYREKVSIWPTLEVLELGPGGLTWSRTYNYKLSLNHNGVFEAEIGLIDKETIYFAYYENYGWYWSSNGQPDNWDEKVRPDNLPSIKPQKFNMKKFFTDLEKFDDDEAGGSAVIFTGSASVYWN